MDEKQTRKNWTGEEIMEVLRRYLVERLELSKVCEETGCCPSQVYRWQKLVFAAGGNLFNHKRSSEREEEKQRGRVEELEKKLRQKDEVLAELMMEHVLLKKKNGDRCDSNGSPRTRGTMSSIL